MSSHITPPTRTFRRMQKRKAMVEGDVESAHTVTNTRLAEVQSDGTYIITTVRESLDPIDPLSAAGQRLQQPISAAGQRQHPHSDNFNYEQPQEMPQEIPASPPCTPRRRKGRVSVDIISKGISVNFVSRHKKTIYWSTFHVSMDFWKLP